MSENVPARKDSTLRKVNAIAAGIIVVLFALHALLGTLKLSFAHMPSEYAALIWAGVVLVALHVVASIGTTAFMLTDKVHPASTAKKRHQLLKWVTGLLLAALAVAHVLLGFSARVVDVLLAAALAWHCYVGTKSLTRDLNLASQLRTPIRACVILIALGVTVSLVVSWRS